MKVWFLFYTWQYTKCSFLLQVSGYTIVGHQYFVAKVTLAHILFMEPSFAEFLKFTFLYQPELHLDFWQSAIARLDSCSVVHLMLQCWLKKVQSTKTESLLLAHNTSLPRTFIMLPSLFLHNFTKIFKYV